MTFYNVWLHACMHAYRVALQLKSNVDGHIHVMLTNTLTLSPPHAFHVLQVVPSRCVCIVLAGGKCVLNIVWWSWCHAKSCKIRRNTRYHELSQAWRCLEAYHLEAHSSQIKQVPFNTIMCGVIAAKTRPCGLMKIGILDHMFKHVRKRFVDNSSPFSKDLWACLIIETVWRHADKINHIMSICTSTIDILPYMCLIHVYIHIKIHI